MLSVKNTLAETFWRDTVRATAEREPPERLKRLGPPNRAILSSLNIGNDYRFLMGRKDPCIVAAVYRQKIMMLLDLMI